MKLNWKWPKTEKKPHLEPWYIVLWRLPFMMVVFFGLAIAWGGLLCAYCSIKTANDVWKI